MLEAGGVLGVGCPLVLDDPCRGRLPSISRLPRCLGPGYLLKFGRGKSDSEDSSGASENSVLLMDRGTGLPIGPAVEPNLCMRLRKGRGVCIL